MSGFLHAFLIFVVAVAPFGSCTNEVHQKNQLSDQSSNQDSHFRQQQINVEGDAYIFNNVIYGGWDPLGKQGFPCPASGRFANPYSCAEYFLCESGVAHLITCPLGQLYDDSQEICKNKELVNCDGRLNREELEVVDDSTRDLTCPYTWGSFSLIQDCSKYIICIYNVPTIYSCRKNELFDMKARRCLPSGQVSCHGRLKPGDSDAETITTPLPSTTATETTTTSRPSSTTTQTTTASSPSTTTTQATTTSRPTPEILQPLKLTRPPMPVTDSRKPNTPPPTNCRKNDVDCIENQTKDVHNWFDCPEEFGHYPHPLSDQLFIYCDRWRPVLKRCAKDEKFSPSFKACVWVGEYKIIDV